MTYLRQAAAAVLVLLLFILLCADAGAAERKSRKDRKKDKPGASTTTTPTAPSSLPAPSTGIQPTPTSPIEIKVVRPQQGEQLTISDGYTFVIGTLPNDQYTLRCNDKLIGDVLADGAFIGYVPVKKAVPPQVVGEKTMDAVFEFVVVTPKIRFTNLVYAITPGSPSAKKDAVEKFAEPKVIEAIHDAWIGMENSTSSDGKPVPNLGKVVFFPKGSRIKVKERKGEMLLIAQTVEDGDLWVNEREFKFVQESPPEFDVSTVFTSEKGPQTTTYYFPMQVPLPIVFTEATDRKTITLQFLCHPPRGFVFPQPSLIWGFDCTHDGNQSIVTVRFTPKINKDNPLQGLKVLVDPGHNPDTGALGPRGTEERNLTLQISKQLAEELKARGAVVTLSHEGQPLDLHARHAKFKSADPDLVLSVHLNSAKDNEDPRHTWGSQTIYLLGHSQPLAKSIQRQLVVTVRGHDQGSVERNLLVTRFPHCPTVLIEPTHIIMPAEEKKLLTPEYRAQIAKAIAEGTANFLLGEIGAKR